MAQRSWELCCAAVAAGLSRGHHGRSSDEAAATAAAAAAAAAVRLQLPFDSWARALLVVERGGVEVEAHSSARWPLSGYCASLREALSERRRPAGAGEAAPAADAGELRYAGEHDELARAERVLRPAIAAILERQQRQQAALARDQDPSVLALLEGMVDEEEASGVRRYVGDEDDARVWKRLQLPSPAAAANTPVVVRLRQLATLRHAAMARHVLELAETDCLCVGRHDGSLKSHGAGPRGGAWRSRQCATCSGLPRSTGCGRCTGACSRRGEREGRRACVT
eukprot:COSAG01_NODE_6138_length_3829_cov_4.557105_4_plen_282_part_00